MKRYSQKAKEMVENPRVDAFLQDVWAVCEKHGMALIPSEGTSDLLVCRIDDQAKESLFEAQDASDCDKPRIW